MDGAAEYQVHRVTIHFLPLPNGITPDPLILDGIAEELSPPTYPFWIVPTADNRYRVVNMSAVSDVDLPRNKPYKPTPPYKVTRLVEG